MELENMTPEQKEIAFINQYSKLDTPETFILGVEGNFIGDHVIMRESGLQHIGIIVDRLPIPELRKTLIAVRFPVEPLVSRVAKNLNNLQP